MQSRDVIDHPWFGWACFFFLVALTVHFDIVLLSISFDKETELFYSVPPLVAMLNLLWVLLCLAWLSMALGKVFCWQSIYKVCDPCANCVGGTDALNKCRERFAALLNLDCLSVEARRVKDGETTTMVPIKIVVGLALILPFNCMFFYFFTASPVLTDDCILYDLDTKGELLKYVPSVGDWVNASNLGFGKDAIPAQPDCMTMVGLLAERWGSSDGDYYEELYALLLHAFAGIVGLFVYTYNDVAVEAGGFVADFFDVYDLYTMSFQNLSLMREGKIQFFTAKLNKRVFTTIIFAYVSIGVRWQMKDCKCLCCTASARTQTLNILGVVMSMLHEMIFFFLRFDAWWTYGVPVSVLLLKNVGAFCFEDLVALITLINECWGSSYGSSHKSDKATTPPADGEVVGAAAPDSGGSTGTCRHWQKGNCKYGEHCRYSHA